MSDILARFRTGIATSSAAETQTLAAEFAAALPENLTLALHGTLGVGKTTFVQGLARGFGVSEPVTSPTFNLYTVHRGHRTLVHLDAYRLENAAQADALLIEDFLTPPWCLAVEWPDNITPWLPSPVWHLDLGILPDQRHTLKLKM